MLIYHRRKANEKNNTILRTKQVCEKLVIKKSSLFSSYMKNPTFPKPVKLGGTNAWKEADIDKWIEQQFEEVAS